MTRRGGADIPLGRDFAYTPYCTRCVFRRLDLRYLRQDAEDVAFPALWDSATYTGKNAALLRNLASVYPEVCSPEYERGSTRAMSSCRRSLLQMWNTSSSSSSPWENRNTFV